MLAVLTSIAISVKMKSRAFEEGLTWSPHIIRMDIIVPADRVSRNQELRIHLQLWSGDISQQARLLLMHQSRSVTGRTPRITSFRFEEGGRRLANESPITSLRTLQPVLFARAAPDN